MNKFGIDAINFYTSNYYLDLQTLAKNRGFPPDKYFSELGQRKMAIMPPGEDIVTLAANAASTIIQNENLNNISAVLFATESGIDFSKAAGIYVHKLLNLPANCRVVELKQACYAATAALQLGIAMLHVNPHSKILIVAADTARYAMHTNAESSQGAGAVAMLLSANPRLLEIEPESGIFTEDNMDFWRPNYREEPFVYGRFSCDLYLRILEETWKQYREKSKRNFDMHDRFCYHIPVPRLVETAHKKLAKINGQKIITKDQMDYQVENSLFYSREIGNCYTASLYLGIISLLEMVKNDLTNKYVGLYSYGSGCAGEYFCARVVPGYKKMLNTEEHAYFLRQRFELSYDEYEKFYNFKLPEDGSEFTVPEYNTGKFKLKGMENHKRIYIAL